MHLSKAADRRVKANKGAAGVDGETIEKFEWDQSREPENHRGDSVSHGRGRDPGQAPRRTAGGGGRPWLRRTGASGYG